MSDPQLVITLEGGKLHGSTKVDYLGGKYYSFQGIPYAKPPIGRLRFKAPQPVEPWTGTKDATKEGNDCFQRNLITNQLVGSEDCLYLNVYTSKLLTENQDLRPVMVWIHGGGFFSGSGSTEFYGPEFLVTEDVVLVTINYRLGLLGFACFADPSLEVPGNAGLKDQVLALKWVKSNIAAFGGDPNNVTIFGESAGAASVHYLMLSPLAKGLFNKAIAQSGVAAAGWSKGQLTAPLLQKILDCNGNEANVLKTLNELSIEKLLEVQEKLPDLESLLEGRAFGVVCESTNDESAFLTREPEDILASGTYNQVPFMIGYTSREGMLLQHLSTMKYGEMRFISDYETVIPYSFKIKSKSAISKKVADEVQRFYFGKEEASATNIDQLYVLGTDTWFVIDINHVLRQHIKTSSCPTYFYRMSIETQLNMFKKISAISRPGVCHADDLGYLFKNFITPPEIRSNSLEALSIKRFVKLWTTFAKYGNPNLVKDDKILNVTWLPVENNKLHYLEIGENLTVGVNPDSSSVEFWDKLYNLYSNKK